MSKVRNIFILSILTITSGMVNYLTYPILLKNLVPADFALFSVFSSILTIISIPSMAYGYMLLIYFRNQDHFTGIMMKSIQRQSARMTILLLLVLIFLVPLVFWILDIHNPMGYLAIFLVALFCFFIVPYSSYLQSRELFLFGWIIWLILALLRFIITTGTIYFPSFGFAMLSLMAPGIAWFFLFRYFATSRFDMEMRENIPINPVSTSSHLSTFFLATIVLVLLQNVDILLVKYLFPITDVALYASVSVITKFAIFIIAILETVYMPTLVDKKNVSEKRMALIQLFLLMLLAFFCAFFVLPYIWTILLNFMQWDILVSLDLFRWLWFSAVSLWFLSLYLKVLIAWNTRTYVIYALIMCWWIALFFTRNLIDFCRIYSLTISIVCIFSCILLWDWVKKFSFTQKKK